MTNPHDVFQERVVIAMVGLPARGKSYLSHAIVRYLNFLGCPTQLFNAGNLRREHGLAGTDANFFDPDNASAKEVREKLAMDCLEELLQSIRRPEGGCSLGILDATNTTVARRKKVVDRCLEEQRKRDPCLKLCFIESYADDQELLEQNYRMKLANDDYKDKDPEQALGDFRERVKKYEAVYEPISDATDGGDISYIKLINAGETLVAKGVEGFVLRRVNRLLGSVHLWPRTIWIALVGETKNDLLGVLGGDSELTDAGLEYAHALCKLIREREQMGELSPAHIEPGIGKIVAYTGTSRRYVKMVQILGEDRKRPGSGIDPSSSQGQNGIKPEYQVLTLGSLNDINAGLLDSLSESEREKRFPDEVAARRADKLNYRYPGVGGESYQDLIARCHELVCLLEQSRGNSVVICDRAVYRVVMGYFLAKSIREIPHLDVKGGVLELRRNEGGFSATELLVDAGKATTSHGPGTVLKTN